MPDMLVKLYDLPPLEPAINAQRDNGVTIRRGMPPEKSLVLPWIRERWGEYWVSESDVAFGNAPPTIWLAQRKDELLGFACHDTTHINFFGPTGVDEAERGQGIGTALLLAALYAMRAAGYMYGIIGWAGPREYYEKTVNAMVIPDAEPPRSYLGLLGTHAVFHEGASSESIYE